MYMCRTVILLVFTISSGIAASQNSTIVDTTKDFRDALYDTSIATIYLQHSLTISGEQWGFVRPEVKRLVKIAPLQHTETEFFLDLSGGTYLASVSGPSGELHIQDVKVRGAYNVVLGSSGSVGLLTLFDVNVPQSMHLHNVTICMTQEVCNRFSNDLRVVASSSKQIFAGLDGVSCTFPDEIYDDPFDTFTFPNECIFPQVWDSSKVSGSIHAHNASLSCAEKCLSSAEPQNLPVVQISTVSEPGKNMGNAANPTHFDAISIHR
ncbi:hypothetical protein BSKO_10133 [Bryopsis sp. KO-2023]|nr:hypothetical protein BSKO_10133 [Bryopsis sp. KO-2023]